jgi:rod shape-determining protein MreD
MTPGPFSRLLLTIRSTTPAAITLILAISTVVPMSMPGGLVVVPHLTLMSVFYWTVYRPDLMPPTVILIIGLLQDLLTGGWLGLTPLLLLGTYWAILPQRRAFLGKPFILTWLGFLVVLSVATLITWLVVSLLSQRLLPPAQSLAQFVTSLLTFPLMVWFFVRTHRRILPQI